MNIPGAGFRHGWGHACVCVYVCIYIYVYMYTHTHTHIYIYIYIYRERERESSSTEFIVWMYHAFDGVYLQGYLAHKKLPPPRTLQ